MTAKILKDLSNEEYHAHKADSRSTLMLLHESAKKYHYKYVSGEAEEETTEALDMGTAFHTLILEPEKLADTMTFHPDQKRPTKSQINAKNPSDSTVKLIEFWDKFDSENKGKIVLKHAQVDDLKGMADAIRSEPAAQKLLGQKGFIEPSIFWTDEETGIDVKCRIDFLPANYKSTIDLKSTASVSLPKFEKSGIDYGYDLQSFMQHEAVRQLTGESPEAMFFVCAEKKKPHDTAFFMADEYVLKRGELLYRMLLRKLAKCRLNNHWPSSGEGRVQFMSIPQWEINKLDELKGDE